MHDYINTLTQRYADFSGRSGRKEYWTFSLINLAVLILLNMLDPALGTVIGPAEHPVGILNLVFSLAMMVPSIAIAVRRLHDLNHSGWWLMACFVPFASLALVIYFLFPGTTGANRFGQDPRQSFSFQP